MNNNVTTVVTTIRKVRWDVDDYYLVVPEIQVNEFKFKEGQKVEVTIEIIEDKQKG